MNSFELKTNLPFGGFIRMLSLMQEEFLRDVMQFLIIRGHSRLVPPGGLAEFPDAVLNSKRLDLFNLYREVGGEAII